jgi:hypothetical protein
MVQLNTLSIGNMVKFNEQKETWINYDSASVCIIASALL